ncbi:MAG: MFS transporter [Fuerstia sp.]|nr:MFS transporter [Fuerstiella sp.]
MLPLLATARTVLRNYIDLPRMVYVLCVGSLINRAGSFVMLFLTIYVTEQLGAGKAFASYCIGAFGFGSVVSSLIGGQLADQFGRRATMLFALFGGATALLFLSLVTNPWLFMGVLFLFAVIIEMYRPASAAMIGDLTSGEQRPHAFGLMYIAVNLGFAVAPPIGGFLASYSFTWLFWADAFTTAMFGGVVFFLMQETRPILHTALKGVTAQNGAAANDQIATAAQSPAGFTQLAAAEGLALLESVDTASSEPVAAVPTKGAAANGEPATSLAGALRHVAGDWTFLLFCFCNLLTSIVFMQGFATLPLYVTERGFTKLEFGTMICVNGAMIVVLQLPLTHVLNRCNRAMVLLAGELFFAVGFGLTVYADSAMFFVGTIVLWTMGEIFQAPYKPTIVSELAPPAMRARYMGVFNLSHALSLMIGAPLGGEILARFGPHVLWPGCFGLLIITMGLYIVLFSRLAVARQSVGGSR